MEGQKQTPQINIDLKSTKAILTPSKSPVFQQGVLLRSVSKFIAGTPNDATMPIPVFFDPESGLILESSIPDVLREELKDFIIQG